MTTLNTIIEEEVDAYKNDYAQAITDVGGFGLAKHIERFLTTAMQRAYEAGKDERDTYWKERVRKAVEEVFDGMAVASSAEFRAGYNEGKHDFKEQMLATITNEDNSN